MGSPVSRPCYESRRTYYLPSETLVQCYGHPGSCYCRSPHIGLPRRVFVDPYCGMGGRGRRYLDPMQYVERLTMQQNNYPGLGDGMLGGGGVGGGVGMGGDVYNIAGGMGGVGVFGGGNVGGVGAPGMGMPQMYGGGGGGGGFGFPYGGFGGLGWKDPRDWTTRDFDVLQDVFEEMVARQRGRRNGRGGGDYYGYDGDRDRGGGRGGGRDLRDVLALMQHMETLRRLNGVENTMYGDENERRNAAFRERLNNVLGGDRYGGGDDQNNRGFGGGFGGGGGNAGARFTQQQRDFERREREQRNVDREAEEIRRHLDRLRGGGGGGWIEDWGLM